MMKATLNEVAQVMVNVVQGACLKLLEFRVGIENITLNSTFCHDKRQKLALLLDLSSPTLKGCKE
jgi:hypothetical protein